MRDGTHIQNANFEGCRSRIQNVGSSGSMRWRSEHDPWKRRIGRLPCRFGNTSTSTSTRRRQRDRRARIRQVCAHVPRAPWEEKEETAGRWPHAPLVVTFWFVWRRREDAPLLPRIDARGMLAAGRGSQKSNRRMDTPCVGVRGCENMHDVWDDERKSSVCTSA
ncbi:hypothetical protein BKA93DRAFT_316874 [Sparassis latifolia]